MAGAQRAARRTVWRPEPGHETEDERTQAMREQAEAFRAQAAATDRLARAVEDLKPAAVTIHSFAARLDALCDWLKSRRPWLYGAASLVVVRTINAAPDEVPKLISALAEFLKAFT